MGMLLGSKKWEDEDDGWGNLFISGAMKEDIKREEEESKIKNPLLRCEDKDDN